MVEPSVPDIDLAGLFGGEPAAEQQVAAQIRQACREVGFFTVHGTNIDLALITEVYHQSALFHGLAEAAKQPVRKQHALRRGWVPLDQEPAYEAGTVSHCESFDLSYELPAASATPTFGATSGNAWPAGLPGFQPTVYEYFLQANRLATALFAAFAGILGQPPDFFTARRSERSPSLMRLLHYPAFTGVAAPEDRGISAHTDFECFTIMHQSAPGLALMDRAGRWCEAPVRPDRFVIILDDMLERWSNGWLRATRHRVATTPWERYSLILFCAVDGAVVVEPLPAFCGPDSPARYAPVTQIDHLRGAVETAAANREALD